MLLLKKGAAAGKRRQRKTIVRRRYPSHRFKAGGDTVRWTSKAVIPRRT
jgi:hypothetical protein